MEIFTMITPDENEQNESNFWTDIQVETDADTSILNRKEPNNKLKLILMLTR